MKIHSLFRYGRRLFCPFLIGCALISTQSAFAHSPLGTLSSHLIIQQQVTGTVQDASGPLAGVTVIVKGTTLQTLTDGDGRYAINALKGDILVFSYIGYDTVEIEASSQTANVLMQATAQSIQEVVVNAGYYSVKESERTGSIARITSKDIESQPVTNVLATMQGRMAGVNVTQTSGVPGGGFEIQIRGQNSLRAEGNSPLYLIDGVPYSSEAVGNSRTTGVLPSLANPLNSINPEDIASIEVLKDADATAIYGSRGANGVVLITTKRGKAGQARLTAGVSQGVGQVTRFMKLLNTQDYLAMRNEAFANDGAAPDLAAYDINGTWDASRYTDWQKELLGGTAFFSDANAGVSGGTGATQFSISGSFHDETTVFPGDYGYRRGVLRSNVSHSAADERFTINFSTAYTAQRNDQAATDLSRAAVSLAPNAPALHDAAGNLNWEGSTWENPLALLEGRYRTKTKDIMVNSMAAYTLLPGVDVKTSFGITDTRHDETRTQPSTLYDPAWGAGPEFSSLYVTATKRQSWIVEPQLSWSQTWGFGKTELLAGGTFQQQKGHQLLQEGNGFSNNSLINNLGSAFSINTLRDQQTDYKYQAFFGRLNYSVLDRYFLNLTGRRDGSSRFGPGKQFAAFGAVGAAWLFGDEAFNVSKKVLSFGKLRGSYGITGNDQIGDYQFLDTYLSSGGSYGGVIGLQPSRLYNPNFGWETSRKLELALETGFFQDRVFMTLAWYNNLSSSQLVGIPMPATTGFNSIQGNLNATVQNRGVEFTLRTVNFQRAAFNWTASLNLSVSKNKLLSFPELEGSTYRNQFVIGQALNIQKVYHYTGLDPQTGVFTFQDVNGDGTLDVQDKQTVKDFNPSFFGGLSNQLAYKRFQLDFLLQFVKQKNYTAAAMAGMPGTMNNQPVEVLTHWQSAGDSAGHQQFSAGYNSAVADAFYKYYESDGVIGDASYVRLKNVALSYKIPEKALYGGNCRISLEGQNLLTFTSYEGRDPEFKTSGFLPPLRVITLGVQFIF